jgi:hypothetical protein
MMVLSSVVCVWSILSCKRLMDSLVATTIFMTRIWSVSFLL